MRDPIPSIVDEIARRGSWFGGGSVVALAAALAAALAEKLLPHAGARRRMRRVRERCVRLAVQDARAFARVIQTMRRHNRQAFTRALQAAITAPLQVLMFARRIDAVCRTAQRGVPTRLQSDLRVARLLASAAAGGAKTLVRTNLAWLGHSATTRRVARRLR